MLTKPLLLVPPPQSLEPQSAEGEDIVAGAFVVVVDGGPVVLGGAVGAGEAHASFEPHASMFSKAQAFGCCDACATGLIAGAGLFAERLKGEFVL